MKTLLQRIMTTAPRALREPRKTIRVLRKRLFPLTAMANDPDAYQLVSNWTFGHVARVPLAQLFPGIESQNITILSVCQTVWNYGRPCGSRRWLAAATLPCRTQSHEASVRLSHVSCGPLPLQHLMVTTTRLSYTAYFSLPRLLCIRFLRAKSNAHL